MSLKPINYIAIVDRKTFYSKDNWVERKPIENEIVITANEPFVCKSNGAQNVDTYQDRKFSDMNIKSAELVITELLPSRYEALKEGTEERFLSTLGNDLESLGYKKLTKEQIKQLTEWFDFLQEKELQEA